MSRRAGALHAPATRLSGAALSEAVARLGIDGEAWPLLSRDAATQVQEAAGRRGLRAEVGMARGGWAVRLREGDGR